MAPLGELAEEYLLAIALLNALLLEVLKQTNQLLERHSRRLCFGFRLLCARSFGFLQSRNFLLLQGIINRGTMH